MSKLIIVGAGGHARSVIDLALQNNNYELVGCLDSKAGDVLGIPVIGSDLDLANTFASGVKNIFIAIGDNHIRHDLFNLAESIGFEPVNIISNQAVISPRAKLGKGICVMAGAVINVNAEIGDNCIVNTHSSIDHDCQVGKSSHVAPGVALSGNVRMGEGAHIGTGAAVIDNITIGEWAYIGAGATVVRDIPAGKMAYGVPARVIRKVDPSQDGNNG